MVSSVSVGAAEGPRKGEKMARKRNFSTFAVAEMLGVDPGSIANWIDAGKLRAYRTPGGHRRVAMEDLEGFLREHNMPVPEELEDAPVRIVVVDDEPDMAAMIAKAILAANPAFQVTQANDGFQAGTVIATLRPQVVILDLRMPGMDGFEVCRQIKSHPATRRSAVIAITAYPSTDSVRDILDCGASRCLRKPLDLDVLLGEVDAAVAAGRK